MRKWSLKRVGDEISDDSRGSFLLIRSGVSHKLDDSVEVTERSGDGNSAF